MKISKWWFIALAVLLVACAPAAPAPVPPAGTVLPTGTLPAPIEPGTYRVGVELQPGIYRGDVEGELPAAICGWQRLKDNSGSAGGIIAADNPHGQFYVEIRDTDYAFKTTCELVPLVSIPAGKGNFPKIIKYGMYLVGRDIRAGTYKGRQHYGTTAPCIWERRSNVAGAADGVIANHHEVGPFSVRVAAGDFAFSTTCELEQDGD